MTATVKEAYDLYVKNNGCLSPVKDDAIATMVHDFEVDDANPEVGLSTDGALWYMMLRELQVHRDAQKKFAPWLTQLKEVYENFVTSVGGDANAAQFIAALRGEPVP